MRQKSTKGAVAGKNRTELDDKNEANSGSKSARKQKDENEKKNKEKGDKRDIERKSSKETMDTILNHFFLILFNFYVIFLYIF